MMRRKKAGFIAGNIYIELGGATIPLRKAILFKKGMITERPLLI